MQMHVLAVLAAALLTDIVTAAPLDPAAAQLHQERMFVRSPPPNRHDKAQRQRREVGDQHQKRTSVEYSVVQVDGGVAAPTTTATVSSNAGAAAGATTTATVTTTATATLAPATFIAIETVTVIPPPVVSVSVSVSTTTTPSTTVTDWLYSNAATSKSCSTTPTFDNGLWHTTYPPTTPSSDFVGSLFRSSTSNTQTLATPVQPLFQQPRPEQPLFRQPPSTSAAMSSQQIQQQQPGTASPTGVSSAAKQSQQLLSLTTPTSLSSAAATQANSTSLRFLRPWTPVRLAL